MPSPIHLVPPTLIYPIAAALLALVVWTLKLVVTRMVQAVQSDRTTIKSDLADVKSELAKQRENHLTHIQVSNEKQVALLEKLVEGQSRQTGLIEGFIQGVHAKGQGR